MNIESFQRKDKETRQAKYREQNKEITGKQLMRDIKRNA